MKTIESIVNPMTGYESPAINVVEIATEGVLCSSFEKWNEDTLEW